MLSKIIFIVFIIFISLMAKAQNFSIMPLGIGSRFERSETQDLVSRQTFHLAFIYDLAPFSVEFSRDQFNSKTSEGNVSIKREYQDYLLWANYQLLGDDQLRFFIGGGFGYFQEQIITRVASFETDSSTQQEFFSGGGAEIRWYLTRPDVLFSSGARMLYSQNFDPELQPHLFLRLGFRF